MTFDEEVALETKLYDARLRAGWGCAGIVSPADAVRMRRGMLGGIGASPDGLGAFGGCGCAGITKAGGAAPEEFKGLGSTESSGVGVLVALGIAVGIGYLLLRDRRPVDTFSTRHGDVKVAYPSDVNEEMILIGLNRSGRSLAKAKRVLESMGAQFVPWADGTPGYAGVFR